MEPNQEEPPQAPTNSNQEGPPRDQTSPKRTVTIKDNIDKKNTQEESFFAKFKKTSTIWKVAMNLFLTGFLFHVIAFGTPRWINVIDAAGNDIMFMGLWSTCTSMSNCTMRKTPARCLNTARGFGGVSILLCLLACLMLVMYVRKPDNRRCIAITTISACGLTAICNQILCGIIGQTSACYADVTSGSSIIWSSSIALSFFSIVCVSASAILFWVQELRTCAGNRPKWRKRIGPGIRIT